MVLSTEWSQVEVIDLLNDGNGLGFILVGGKSTGVVIKALTPGGIAERDGRIQCGDHVLQIGEINLRGFNSEQAATVLRQTGVQVRLVVARPVEPTSVDYQTLASHAPIIPTRLLSDPDELDRQLVQSTTFSGPYLGPQEQMLQAAAAAAAAQAQLNEEMLAMAAATQQQQQQQQQQDSEQQQNLYQQMQQARSPTNVISLAMLPLHNAMLSSPGSAGSDGDSVHVGVDSESSAADRLDGLSDESSMPETETFDVVLHRNVYGLGIRVAGYVCEEEDLSGIFVKSMVEGGAGELGRIRINDRILAVDGRSVAEATNHEAVTLLKNSGITVALKIERFLRGRKYEHLQVALNDMKEVNIATTATAATTPATRTPAEGGRCLLIGSDTMQSMAQLSLPPSPSCATLTWMAPRSDADSLATVDIDYPDVVFDERQIDAEFESHTTADSEMYLVHGSEIVDEGAEAFSKSPSFSSGHSSFSSPAATPPPLPEAPSTLRRLARLPSESTDAPAPIPSIQTPPDIARTSAACNGSPQWHVEYPGSEIIVAQLNKLAGLGISLEGTVDVEGGIEKRPHHFIRSILKDGPVGTEGSLRPGDEILQVNEHRLQGLRHTDVVKILKDLPVHVRMVCARGPSAPSVINTSQNLEAFQSRSILAGGLRPTELAMSTPAALAAPALTARANTISNDDRTFGDDVQQSRCWAARMVKAHSESSLFTSSTATGVCESLFAVGHRSQQQRSRSVEQVSGLALWSTEVVLVDLQKTEYGFGFSILDYQDPLDVDGTVIVVRGLIPGGAAESSAQLFPGDRIVSVGGIPVHGRTLDEAVDILKGMPLGLVRIGLCRPLCVSDESSASLTSTPT